MPYTAVIYEKKDGVATITLNLPESLNCLTGQLVADFKAAVSEAEKDKEIKAVIITGAGKAFCAGGDIKRFTEGFTVDSGVEYVDNFHPFCLQLVNLTKPTIAAVNGAAVGAGLSIALMCDVIFVSDKAKMGSAFINMALIPDLACAYFLPRTIGPHRAKDLLMTGRIIDSTEAYNLGIATRVIAHDDLLAEANAYAAKLAAGPSFSISNTKRMVNMSLDMDIRTLLDLESYLQSLSFMTEDSSEAVTAFLGKRPPVFKGK